MPTMDFETYLPTNAPGCYSDLAVESLRRLKLGAEIEELLSGGNLARILDWPAEGKHG